METKEFKQYEWDKSFLETADIFTKHSKCAAKKVACVLVKNNAIISIGINGTLPGLPNCNEKFFKDKGKWYSIDDSGNYIPCHDNECHSKWSKKNEVHAEVNAISKAAREGISVEGSTAYITHSPCHTCSLLLASSGVKRVVFKEIYDAEPEAIDLLKAYGVEVVTIRMN